MSKDMPYMKLLIIEDDLFYQTYVNDLLKETSIDVVNAMDGEKGMEMALSERPDIILTDIEIPKIQGFTLLGQLREREETSHIPVIMMSGKVEKALLDRHAQLAVHADGYLLKPFSRQELLEMIERALPGEKKKEPETSMETEPAAEDHLKPRMRPEAGATGAQRPVDPTRQMRHRLKPLALVVDDSHYVCDLTRELLEEAGYSVQVAMDGKEALRLVREELPDIVLLDVQMPELDGFEVCELMKNDKITARIPVILMSAVVDMETFERHSRLDHHADAYIQKPFKKHELLDLFHEHLPAVSSYEGVEKKTGFIVPGEDDLIHAPVDHGVREPDGPAPDPGEAGPLDPVGGHPGSEEQLVGELQIIREEKEQLGEKVTLATKRAEKSGDALTEAQGEIQKLRMNLEAALAAKREIEDQAAAMAEKAKKGPEGPDVGEELPGLREENREQASRLEEIQGQLEASELRKAEMEAEVSAAMELSRKLKEDLRSQDKGTETAVNELERFRADFSILEDSAAEQKARVASLESDLEERRTAVEQESGMRKELEERLLTLQSEKGPLERELSVLRTAADGADELRATIGVLNKEKELLQERLRENLALQEAARLGGDGSGPQADFSGRLSQIEDVLKRTVTEAQQVLLEQKSTEDDLQNRLREMMRSLEAERTEHQRERDNWQAKEGELKNMVEDFLDERRRMMGDEIARMFPVHVRGDAQTYEVVSGRKKLGNIALVLLLVVVAFLLGFLTLSKIEGRGGKPPEDSRTSLKENRPVVEVGYPVAVPPDPAA